MRMELYFVCKKLIYNNRGGSYNILNNINYDIKIKDIYVRNSIFINHTSYDIIQKKNNTKYIRNKKILVIYIIIHIYDPLLIRSV